MRHYFNLLVVGMFIYTANLMGQQAAPIRVALFADPASTDAKSRDAVLQVLSREPGIVVDNVTTETVQQPGFLNDHDVFILPGGTASGEAKAIGAEAGRAIACKVRQGKGLVAICAGGYYLAEGWNEATEALDIIKAKNHDGKHWARGEQFIAVESLRATDATSSHTMWYENGPIFVPTNIEGLTSYTPLVRYVTDLAAKDAPTGQMAGRDAVIASNYGAGRVVAFGPHPELSPDLNHWLVNAVKWAAVSGADTEITAGKVLDGMGQLAVPTPR